VPSTSSKGLCLSGGEAINAHHHNSQTASAQAQQRTSLACSQFVSATSPASRLDLGKSGQLEPTKLRINKDAMVAVSCPVHPPRIHTDIVVRVRDIACPRSRHPQGAGSRLTSAALPLKQRLATPLASLDYTYIDACTSTESVSSEIKLTCRLRRSSVSAFG